MTDEQKIVAKQREKIALPILYTFPGNPSMFQGTENCTTGYKVHFVEKIWTGSVQMRRCKHMLNP